MYPRDREVDIHRSAKSSDGGLEHHLDHPCRRRPKPAPRWEARWTPPAISYRPSDRRASSCPSPSKPCCRNTPHGSQVERVGGSCGPRTLTTRRAHRRRWLIFGLVAAAAWIYSRRPSSSCRPPSGPRTARSSSRARSRPGGARSSSRLRANCCSSSVGSLSGRAVACPDPTSDLLRVSDRGCGCFDRDPPLPRWRFPVPLVARFICVIALLSSPQVDDVFAALSNAHWWLAIGLISLGMLRIRHDVWGVPGSWRSRPSRACPGSLPFTAFRCWASAPSETARAIPGRSLVWRRSVSWSRPHSSSDHPAMATSDR